MKINTQRKSALRGFSLYTVFFLVLFFMMIHQAGANVQGQSFCVQTLNTYGIFYANGLEERHQRTLDFLRQNKCDAVLLQEILYLNHYDNFALFSEQNGMNSVYFNKSSKDIKISGMAALVEGPFEDNGMEFFPDYIYNGFLENIFNSIKVIDKGFGYVQTRLPEIASYPVLLINIHLHHLSKRMRVKQLLFYLKWILNVQSFGGVIISAGDFNFTPESLEYDMMQYLFQFRDSFKETGNSPFCTFLCDNSDEVIKPFLIGGKVKDYIFFKAPRSLEVKVSGASTFPRKHQYRTLSDHYGIEAVFHIQEKSRPRGQSHLLTRDIETRRVRFKNTLEEVEAFLREERDSFGFNFIETLKKDLNRPESPVMRYLRL